MVMQLSFSRHVALLNCDKINTENNIKYEAFLKTFLIDELKTIVELHFILKISVSFVLRV